MHDPSLSTSPTMSPLARRLYLALGFVCVGLAAVGAVLPIVPTTCFLIAALWAFGKSSPRFHRWLFTHPRFGPPLQAWSRYRVIPRRAKVMSVVSMGLALVIVSVAAGGWVVPALTGLVLGLVAGYILTRPGAVPA